MLLWRYNAKLCRSQSVKCQGQEIRTDKRSLEITERQSRTVSAIFPVFSLYCIPKHRPGPSKPKNRSASTSVARSCCEMKCINTSTHKLNPVLPYEYLYSPVTLCVDRLLLTNNSLFLLHYYSKFPWDRSMLVMASRVTIMLTVLLPKSVI